MLEHLLESGQEDDIFSVEEVSESSPSNIFSVEEVSESSPSNIFSVEEVSESSPSNIFSVEEISDQGSSPNLSVHYSSEEENEFGWNEFEAYGDGGETSSNIFSVVEESDEQGPDFGYSESPDFVSEESDGYGYGLSDYGALDVYSDYHDYYDDYDYDYY